jgi:hypothetical protein
MNPNDNLINVVAEALEQIWHEYESKERYFTYDENGVKFDYYKCSEQRICAMGSAVMLSFQTAQSRFHKEVLLRAFEVALKNIESKMEIKDLNMTDLCIFEASLMTFNKMKKDLAKTL